MNKLVVTVDLDWASEAAIEATLGGLKDKNIYPTIFATHQSSLINSCMNELEVGLHPYFATDSSHGATIPQVVNCVTNLPHNLKAYRCHRFGSCNTSQQALIEAGMLYSSNVCTDLEVVPPFKDRFGAVEVPIFMEDGGYLWRQHPLELTSNLTNAFLGEGAKVLLIHPMHYVLNTPHFSYMVDVKKSLNRNEWNTMTKSTLHKLRWKGRGIRTLIDELLDLPNCPILFSSLATSR